MRYAILSDIHGNLKALDICLKEIQNMQVDAYILCGDYITDVPHAHEVLERIKELERNYTCYIIKGNREDYIIHFAQDQKGKHKNKINFSYTLEQLTKEDIEYISQMPDSIEITQNNIPIYVSHKKDEETTFPIKIYGHRHVQERNTIDGITYINAGSVGIPADSFVGTEFAILDIEGNNITTTFKQIAYPIDEVIHELENSKLVREKDKWGKLVIKGMLSGKDYAFACMEKVLQIAKEQGIPEEDISCALIEEVQKSMGVE